MFTVFSQFKFFKKQKRGNYGFSLCSKKCEKRKSLSIKFNPLSEQVDTVGFDPTEKGSIPLGGVQIREIGSSFHVFLLYPLAQAD